MTTHPLSVNYSDKQKTVPFHFKRLELMASQVFKVVNKFSPEYIQDLINVKISPYNFKGKGEADLQ